MTNTAAFEETVGAPKQGHPTGLYVLFGAEMWERFSYYGMRALLVLYLTKHLKYERKDALALYATYTGLVYLTPLLGGYLADRFLGQRKAIMIGGLLMALGHFAMAFEPLLNLALGLIILGNGYFKPNISTMVGQLYPQGDARRDSAYTIFYMGINLGAFFSPLVCGSLGERVGWHYGFGAAGVGMLLGLMTFAAMQRKLGDQGYPPGPSGMSESRLTTRDWLHVVGLTLVGVVTDLAGTIRARVEHRVDRPTPADAMPLLAAMPIDLARGFRFDRTRLLGIGMSMPGPFDVFGLTSVGPTALPGWQDFPLASELEKMTGITVTVENDATAAAIGERLYGVARNLSSFVYLFLGTGLGAGLFLDGHLYKGSRHNAGEVGHMVVRPGGLACGCGKRGCLERYVSLRAAYESLALPDIDHASPELLEELLARGDSRIEAWIATAAEPLRQAINVLELALDPETVVLGGFMPPAIIERLAAQLEPLPMSVSTIGERAVPRVVIGAAGKDTSVLGAAALPIFSETNPQFDVLQKPLA